MPKLYLDLGQKTGWCLAPAPLLHGYWDLKPGRFESHGVRFLNFLRRLGQIHTEYGVEEIVYEEVRKHRGTDAAHAYGGYMAQLQVWALERDIPFRAVPVGAIKRAAAGKGNADKAAVMAGVRAKGYDVKDENEADAVALMIADRMEMEASR